eukprot:CAMPEP_0176290954 /NCGR_PEP_ID=MMETSP0121_2-20121125/55294_1 /TAXON_ID=160619 /ORGANISM="Kryptoperidinium foliaceum, Strain CCMP 1326" /LENGTH=80 /DNA_ID=CAMNT_0017631771 /DNA_START=70 /DNA_END=310 /DNA_ORIENTATION=-
MVRDLTCVFTARRVTRLFEVGKKERGGAERVPALNVPPLAASAKLRLEPPKLFVATRARAQAQPGAWSSSAPNMAAATMR